MMDGWSLMPVRREIHYFSGRKTLCGKYPRQFFDRISERTKPVGDECLACLVRYLVREQNPPVSEQDGREIEQIIFSTVKSGVEKGKMVRILPTIWADVVSVHLTVPEGERARFVMVLQEAEA